MARHFRRIKRLVPFNGVGVEIGTWKGASAARWLKAGLGTLFCVDPYRQKTDNSWESRANMALIRQAAYRRLWRYRNRVEFMRYHSTTAASMLGNGRFDFIYIDADHSYEAVKADLAAWWPKLRPGGVMIIDDYLRGRWWGDDVIRAVDEFPQPAVIYGRWAVMRK